MSHAEARIHTLATFSKAVASARLEPAVVLSTTVQEISAAIGDAAGVFVLSDDAAELRLAAIHHPDPAARQVIVEMFEAQPHPAMTGLLGQVRATGDTLLIPDISLDMLRSLYAGTGYDRFFDHFQLRGLIAAAMSANGHDLGVLAVIRTHGAVPYTPEDAAFVEDLAERAALGLDNALHYARTANTAAVLEAVFRTAVDCVIVIDASGVIRMANEATSKLFGYGPDELIGSNVSMLMPEPDHSAHEGYLARYVRTGEARIIGIGREVRGRAKSGAVVPLQLAVSEVDQPGERMFAGILRDISASKRAEQRLASAANTDALTGLVNRVHFRELLELAISHADPKPLAVAYVDLDNFKVVNDTYGHSLGDQVLSAAARRLAGVARASDVTARWGGDEFTLLAEREGPDAVARLSRRIHAAFAEPIAVHGNTFRVGASAGVALFPEDAWQADDILRIADDRMYAVKASRRRRQLTT